MFVVFLILKIILLIFTVLVGLLVLLLALPVTYSGQFVFSGEIKYSYSLGWPWKIVKLTGVSDGDNSKTGIYLGKLRILKLDPSKKEKLEKKKDKKEDNKEEDEKEKKKSSFKEIMNKQFLGEMLAYIKKIINILRPKHLHLKGIYGFEDPAVTGMTIAAVEVIKTYIPNAKLYLYPDFTEPKLDIDIKADGRVVLGSLVYQTARTFLKKDIRKIIFKKNRKK